MTRNDLVHQLLQIRDQLHVIHWQTRSYAQHKALDETYTKLLDLADEFVEDMTGRYGDFKIEKPIEVKNINEVKLQTYVVEVIGFLKGVDSVIKDTDLLNIRDEMLGVFHKLKYLLRLE